MPLALITQKAMGIRRITYYIAIRPIFPRILMNGTTLKKKRNIACYTVCFGFPYKFLFPEKFLILRRSDRDMIICVHTLCQILMKTELPQQIFEKISKYQIW